MSALLIDPLNRSFDCICPDSARSSSYVSRCSAVAWASVLGGAGGVLSTVTSSLAMESCVSVAVNVPVVRTGRSSSSPSAPTATVGLYVNTRRSSSESSGRSGSSVPGPVVSWSTRSTAISIQFECANRSSTACSAAPKWSIPSGFRPRRAASSSRRSTCRLVRRTNAITPVWSTEKMFGPSSPTVDSGETSSCSVTYSAGRSGA